MFSVSVRDLFHQPMAEKIKTRTIRFPTKENPNMEKALFDWPVVLQYDVKAKHRLISRKFSDMRSISECGCRQRRLLISLLDSGTLVSSCENLVFLQILVIKQQRKQICVTHLYTKSAERRWRS